MYKGDIRVKIEELDLVKWDMIYIYVMIITTEQYILW